MRSRLPIKGHFENPLVKMSFAATIMGASRNTMKVHDPCIKCGREAVTWYSPDLDIKGLWACSEHRDDIILSLRLYVLGFISEQQFKKQNPYA